MSVQLKSSVSLIQISVIDLPQAVTENDINGFQIDMRHPNVQRLNYQIDTEPKHTFRQLSG